MALIALWSVAAVADPLWTVDASPVAAVNGVWPLSASSRCPEGQLVPLGVAVVLYGRRSGASAYGHASLRVTWCADGGLHDQQYEVYRLGGWNERMLRIEHAGEPWVDEAIREQRGAAVLFRVEHPVDGGWYRESMLDNREIYELWLDLPEERAIRVIREADAWYAAQRAALAAHEPLEPSYVAWSRNCTTVLRRLLPELDPDSALPFVWMRALEEGAALRVMHPSSAVARRWAADWPSEVERPHPVARPGKRWPEEVVPGEPVVPWSSSASGSAASRSTAEPGGGRRAAGWVLRSFWIHQRDHRGDRPDPPPSVTGTGRGARRRRG